MAPNTFLCFLLPIVLVLGTVVGAYEDKAEELANGFIQQESSRRDVPGECPPREYWGECGASCQKNCSNINDNPGTCTEVCLPGCMCAIGFVRGPNGYCIKPKECPAPSSERGLEERIELEVDNSNKDGFPITLFCKRNEVGSLCPSTCPDNCTNYQDKHRECFTLCIPGCVCKSGYIKGPNGTCIKPEECPREKKPEDCTKYEYYDTCGTSCEVNCDNYKRIDRQCVERCNIGCFCLPGYVRGPNGTCIWPFDCETQAAITNDQPLNRVLGGHSELELENSQHNTTSTEKDDGIPIPFMCRKNEVWAMCSSTCTDNCTNYQDKHRGCFILCIPGCVCKSGYIEGPNGTCIKPEECPGEKKPEDCPKYEYYHTCGTSCEDTCDNFFKFDRQCDERCNKGCFCLPGYVRGPNGTCIWPFDCETQAAITNDQPSNRVPEQHTGLEMENSQRNTTSTEQDNDGLPLLPGICEGNEIWTLCSSACPANCTNYQDKNRNCGTVCIPRCVCRSGFVIGPNGKCIKPDQCPREKRPEDCTDLEYYDTCGTACDDCKNYNLPNKICEKRCKIGCFCLPGYVRGPTGGCILPFDCPASKAESRLADRLGEPTELEVTLEQNDESDVEVNVSQGENGGCPDIKACLRFCRQSGFRYGFCWGSMEQNCQCGL